MPYIIKCSKCGNVMQTSGSRTRVQCLCGQYLDPEDGECEHHKKKGECNDPKCEFNKK